MQNDLDRINRRVYGTRGAVRQYGAAVGWIDAGEQRAIALASAALGRSKVLDLGIGGGRTVDLLRGLGGGYAGVDYTPALAAAARARHPGVDISEMDARRLTFADASFGLVFFSYNGIDSVDADGRAAVLREAWRVLEPGGAFVFSSLNRRGSAYGAHLWTHQAQWHGVSGALRYARRIVRGFWNQTRNRALFQAGAETALSTISVHDFGMVTMFIAPEAQVRELECAGFAVEAVLDDCAGRDVRDQLRRTTAPWLYYVARKPGPVNAACAPSSMAYAVATP